MTHSTFAPLLASVLLVCSGCASAPESASDDGPLATASAALGQNALTPAEEKTALKLIDDICGDTWCEGDDDFRFDALVCKKASRSCTLSLEILPLDGAPGAPGDYHRTCRTPDFTGFASLVSTASNGYQSLDQDYYFALTDCISALEAELAARPSCPASSAAAASPQR